MPKFRTKLRVTKGEINKIYHEWSLI